MATLNTDDLIDQAATLLFDNESNTRWGTDELTDYLNEAARTVVSLKPEANTVNEDMTLAEGTKQSLPTGGVQFMRLVRNLGTDGNTPGDAIAPADFDAMDRDAPGWHTVEADDAVVHYLFREQDPLHFYVYPPQPSSGQGHVEIVYAKAPSAVAYGSGDKIPLEDIYYDALLDYVLYQAYFKNNAIPGNQSRSMQRLRSFRLRLGLKDRSEAIHDPALRERTRSEGATIT